MRSCLLLMMSNFSLHRGGAKCMQGTPLSEEERATQGGVEVAETGRFAKAFQEHLDRNYKELEDTIDYMTKQRSAEAEGRSS